MRNITINILLFILLSYSSVGQSVYDLEAMIDNLEELKKKDDLRDYAREQLDVLASKIDSLQSSERALSAKLQNDSYMYEREIAILTNSHENDQRELENLRDSLLFMKSKQENLQAQIFSLMDSIGLIHNNYVLLLDSIRQDKNDNDAVNLTAEEEVQRQYSHVEFLNTLIPDDWVLLDSASGDLNQDGLLDFVFAMQGTDPNYISQNEGFGESILDENPRVMAIYFGNHSGSFEEVLVSDQFIIRATDPTMAEPFHGFDINSRGILDINFGFWSSAGTWFSSNSTHRFRYENNEFVLIGFDSNEFHRGSGEFTSYSINFLTGKMKVTEGSLADEGNETIKWKDFNSFSPKTLRSLVTPFQNYLNGVSF